MGARERIIQLVHKRDAALTERQRLNSEIESIERELDELVPDQAPLPLQPSNGAGVTDKIIYALRAASPRAVSASDLIRRVSPVKPKSFRSTIYRLKREKRIKSSGRGMYKIMEGTN